MTQATDKRGEREKQLQDGPALGETGAPEQGGRAGGDLQRKIGSRDEQKRAFERPNTATRVRKKDEKD